MKIFGRQTGSDVGAVGLFSVGHGYFLIFCIVSGCEWSILWMVAVVDNFFDLMFDLFLADGAVGGGGVF